MNNAKVEGTTVKVGDWVGFKCDVEQSGKISKIGRGHSGQIELTLTREDEGLEGGYIGGQNVTTELASDCWI